MTNDPWGAPEPPETTPPDAVGAPEPSSGAGSPPPAATRTAIIGRGTRVVLAGSLLVAVAFLGVAVGHLAWTRTIVPQRSAFPSFGGFPSSSSTPSAGPKDASAIKAKVDPGLVDISSTFSYDDSAGAATGIVLTSNGEVLTNNHVVDGATTLSVTDIGNGRTYAATVVGYDAKKDLAVLQLTGASGLRTAAIGDSSSATVGEAVLAIGNAGGVGGTPSAAGGTITGLGKSIIATDALAGADEHLKGLIATDADVVPGDSGGPLVNGKGQVLAIDTAGSGSQGFSLFAPISSGAAGYAIPIDEAVGIAQQIEYGVGSSTVHVGATAFLGVLLSTRPQPSGVLVENVVGAGAAAGAGIVAGDTITSIGGQAVSAPSDVSKALVPLHPGDTVKVKGTTPSGHSFTVTVTLGSGPPA